MEATLVNGEIIVDHGSHPVRLKPLTAWKLALDILALVNQTDLDKAGYTPRKPDAKSNEVERL